MIVGATSNIGCEIVKSLDSDKHRLVLVGRNKQKLEELNKQLSQDCIVIVMDLEKEYEYEKVFYEIKKQNIKLDGMIYCSGICYLETAKAMDYDKLKTMFDINLFGFYGLSAAFSSPKYSNKGATIIGVSSYSAITLEKGMSAYAISKAAMNAQAKVFAKEFIKRKITINTIMPANTESKMGTRNNPWTAEEIVEVEKKQPLGLVTYKSIIDLVNLLLSDSGKYITGETIVISAGYGM